jgi:glycolate oxidase FAD binding subunit
MTIMEPATPQELASELKRANSMGLALAPRGGGTKADWGNPSARCDAIVSTARLNRVLEHAWADLTVTVEAGCTLANLQATLAERGQRLAVDALWPERATVGGILSTNDTGALRLSFGGLRDLIIGATVALADGTLAMSGGKVVKNVAGYDLSKLVTGALGTLGVITQAVFRVHPLPRNSRTLTITPASPEQAQEILLEIQASQLAHSALQLRSAGDQPPSLDILFEGTEAGIAAQVAQASGLHDGLQAGVIPDVWNTRQTLWSAEGAIVKLSVLPSDIAKTITSLGQGSAAVIQANGLGQARLAATPDRLHALRAIVERRGGTLTVLRQPAEGSVETWGNPGDSFPLMRALKQQFDSQGTLNPGRYVGGI